MSDSFVRFNSHRTGSNSHDEPTRRGLLRGAGALVAAGWIGGVSGGWMLPLRQAYAAEAIKVGIATDVTGAIAAAGNACWQTAQLAAEEINASGGINGRQIQLFLEDTGSDPKIGVANVRKLIQQHKVNVIVGGITSAMRQAIKDPIVNRGKTLYVYPEFYEGQECTPGLFSTAPVPAQQCDQLIPYLIKTLGKKRFAMAASNYLYPQVVNQYARKLIEANGGEVVFEEYYPIEQAEYSATISKIRNGKVDCIFNTIIPPGVQPFTKQLYESGFQRNGGVVACLYYDENALNLNPARELDGAYSCLDYFQSVDDPFSQALLARYNKTFPGTKYQFTAGGGSTGTYRGIKLYAEAVKATNGDLAREAVAAMFDRAKLAQGPGGPCEMVLGKQHARMNMYLARCKANGETASLEIVRKFDMVEPREC